MDQRHAAASFGRCLCAACLFSPGSACVPVRTDETAAHPDIERADWMERSRLGAASGLDDRRKAACIMRLLLVIALLLAACSPDIHADQIAVYSFTSFHGWGGDPVIVLEDEEAVNAFTETLSEGSRLSGAVDVVEPDWTVVLDGKDAWHLWLDDENGSAMHADDTHTLYEVGSTEDIQAYLP